MRAYEVTLRNVLGIASPTIGDMLKLVFDRVGKQPTVFTYTEEQKQEISRQNATIASRNIVDTRPPASKDDSLRDSSTPDMTTDALLLSRLGESHHAPFPVGSTLMASIVDGIQIDSVIPTPIPNENTLGQERERRGVGFGTLSDWATKASPCRS